MTRRRALLDLALVAATAVAFLVLDVLLHRKALFIALAATVWLTWIAVHGRSADERHAWGLRGDTLRASLRMNVVMIVVAGALMIAIGLALGRPAPSGGFYALLAVYPLYGALQQLVLCGVLHRAVLTLVRREGRAHAISAVLFGALHAPVPALAALTLVAGAVWLALFRRAPNIYAQGLSHGWLGAIAYHFLLGHDPWRELMASLGR